VTPADCAAALRDAWSAPGGTSSSPATPRSTGDANAAVAAAYAASPRASAVAPTDAEAQRRLGLFRTSARRARSQARTHVDDLDFTEVTFANGVRLNLKKTDFEANTIHVAGRLGTGPADGARRTEPGLATFTSLTYSAGGLGKHSADDLSASWPARRSGSPSARPRTRSS
jgi:zinc protease